MKVLVLGATGLIGSAVCARLAADGHRVVAAARSMSGPRPLSPEEFVAVDMARLVTPQMWQPLLEGIEIVVNCAGTLQDGPRENVRGVHAQGPAALFLACERAGVRRVIHFSAMGVERMQPSDFSRTKLEGEQSLMASELDWVILRPSVVLGDGAFGASALFRALAVFPWLPVMPSTGNLQVVQLDDVVATVAYFASPEAPGRVTLDLAGPQELSFNGVVASYRKWFGWPPARPVKLSPFVSRILYWLGDAAGQLGWRPPMRTTAAKEIVRGATGDPREWMERTGIRPLSLEMALSSRPVTVQERWFAKLYFLKALTFIVLPLFWIATGVISLTVGYQIGIDLMHRGGAGVLAAPAVIAGALADIAVGVCIAYRPLSRWGLYGAIFLCLFYALAGTIILPELWNEPLGPLLKIWPILVLHLIALAILKER
jgi:uncharacterized protein YbjT (DUF2867 family)